MTRLGRAGNTRRHGEHQGEHDEEKDQGGERVHGDWGTVAQRYSCNVLIPGNCVFFKPEIKACASTRVWATRPGAVGAPDAGGQSNDSNHARVARRVSRPCYICTVLSGPDPNDAVSISFACLHPRSFCHPQFTRTPLVRDDRRKAPQVAIWSSSVDPHRSRCRRCSRPGARSWIGPWTQAPPSSCLTTVN